MNKNPACWSSTQEKTLTLCPCCDLWFHCWRERVYHPPAITRGNLSMVSTSGSRKGKEKCGVSTGLCLGWQNSRKLVTTVSTHHQTVDQILWRFLFLAIHSADGEFMFLAAAVKRRKCYPPGSRNRSSFESLSAVSCYPLVIHGVSLAGGNRITSLSSASRYRYVSLLVAGR